jgi:hypothetical protein
MTKTKRTDTVKTGVFTKEVPIKIDKDEIERKETEAGRVAGKIQKVIDSMAPERLKVSQLRAEHRKLVKAITSGTDMRTAKVYEVKNFKKGFADIYLVDTDEKVDQRTLEKSDYNADVEDEEAGEETEA